MRAGSLTAPNVTAGLPDRNHRGTGLRLWPVVGFQADDRFVFHNGGPDLTMDARGWTRIFRRLIVGLRDWSVGNDAIKPTATVGGQICCPTYFLHDRNTPNKRLPSGVRQSVLKLNAVRSAGRRDPREFGWVAAGWHINNLSRKDRVG